MSILFSHNTPQISVIMTVYNGDSYLKESIQSILNQTFTDFEFIIINDGSTDQTLQLIENYSRKDKRIKALHSKKMGRVNALNKALAIAQAPLIANLDADDISHPQRLEKQYKLFSQNKNLVLCGTKIRIFNTQNSDLDEFSVFTENSLNKWILSLFSIAHSSVMYKKTAAINCDGYLNEEFPAEDYGFIIRMKNEGEISCINETLVNYRLNPRGTTATKLKEQILKRNLLSKKNLEDLYKKSQIPKTDDILNHLSAYKLTLTDKKMLSKLACLTGCFLLNKNNLKEAKSFFSLAMKIDNKRIDAFINKILLTIKKGMLISIDYPRNGKNMIPLIQIEWFSPGKF